jgi:hypothetical protein
MTEPTEGVFRGICRGGYLDGLMFANFSKRVVVMQETEEGAREVAERSGEYVWADGVWTWTPEN